MSDSTRSPKQQKKTRSGEHPAVRAYRAKIDSIKEGTTEATIELDRKLQNFLLDLRLAK